MSLFAGRAPDATWGAAAGRATLIAFVAVAVLYAPVGITAMWWAFDPRAPHLLDTANAVLSGSTYARGPESIPGIRAEDYAHHRLVMLVHTVLGTGALLLGAGQWLARGRIGRRAHRRLGSLYLSAMTLSMATAIAFLLVAPDPDFVAWTPFRLQLWLLAGSTLGTGALAVVAARAGDVRAHRAWMALNLSFMMTAPLLRVGWTLLGPVLPGRTMLDNLGASSVALAVVAPSLGVLVAFKGGLGAAPEPTSTLGRRWLTLPVVVGFTGSMALLLRFDDLPGAAAVPAYPWFHVLPVAAILAGSVLAAGSTGERRWWIVAAASASMPWFVLLFWRAGEPFLGQVGAAVGGLMLVPGFPLVTAMVALIRHKGRPCPAPEEEVPCSPSTSW